MLPKVTRLLSSFSAFLSFQFAALALVKTMRKAIISLVFIAEIEFSNGYCSSSAKTKCLTLVLKAMPSLQATWT